jgi:hypothetical protein
MTAIADQLDRLAERGPHADPGLVVARATSIATGATLADTPPPDGSHWRPILVAAAAVIIIVGGVAVLAASPASNTPTSSPAQTGTSPTGPSQSEHGDEAVRLVMQPGTEPFPESMVASDEELVDSTNLVTVRSQDEVAHLFLYDVRADDGVMSRCTAVTGTVAQGSSCSPLGDRSPDPVIGPTYMDGDRATVVVSAPADTEMVELHFQEHTLEVVPVEGWAVVPTATSEVCPTFHATAHLPDGEIIQGNSPTPCFPPPSE